MSDHSAIEWTDATWSPTLGCLKVSDGCTNCYAIRTAYRQEHAFKRADYAGLTRKLPDGSLNWTGKVNVLPERLKLPLTWTKPRRVFVDSQSDLFHDDVPDEFIAQVFGVMALSPQHTYQILTKRPQRMLQWLTARRPLETTEEYVAWWALQLPGCPEIVWDARGSDPENYSHVAGLPGQYGSKERAEHLANRRPWPGWPLPNVWMGVSVEDQRAANERIPLLLQTPAAVRFLSCEPLLGPVNLRRHDWMSRAMACDGMCDEDAPGTCQRPEHRRARISWVIAGGESGPNARPMDPDWARSLRDQCQAAGVAFHFKQHGGRTHSAGGRLLDGREWNEYPTAREAVPT